MELLALIYDKAEQLKRKLYSPIFWDINPITLVLGQCMICFHDLNSLVMATNPSNCNSFCLK